MTKHISVFDGHNDVLLRLYKSTSKDVVTDFLEGEEAGHIDLKKNKREGKVGACKKNRVLIPEQNDVQ